ncbi:acyl-CoA thioesterase [Corynebacterium urogenitale]
MNSPHTGAIAGSKASAVAVKVPLDIRWSDQDINGHINSGKSITLVEEARVRAGVHWAGNVPSTAVPRVVRSLHVEFQREVHYGPELTALVWISRAGNTSYTVSHELIQNGHVVVYAEAPIVVLDPETRKPTAIDREFRERLHRYSG